MHRFRFIVVGVGGILGLIILLAGIGFFLPSSYKVERSIVIKAPIDTVFAMVHDMEYWEQWSPWLRNDPNLTVHFSEKTTGVGAWQHWTSPEIGNGMLRYVEVEEPRLIRYVLEIYELDSDTEGSFIFEEVEDGIKLTWVDRGSMGDNPLQRYMGLIAESMMGKDFEDGLMRIKQACE